MAAATTLEEATTFANENVWAKFVAVSALKPCMDIWVNGFQDALDPNVQVQFEAIGWAVPSQAVNQALPTDATKQTAEQAQQTVEVISRALQRFEALEDDNEITAGQVAAILVVYNVAWA
jgi:hypothetical protein